MPLAPEPFEDIPLSAAQVDALIDGHERATLPALDRLWAYYRNPMSGHNAREARPYRLAQERGLPSRLRRRPDDDRAASREIVIENDIAWRIDSLVDFVFGRPVRLVSLAEGEQRRQEIESILDAAWEASGGVALLQSLGLMGGVFGHVDLVLRGEILPSRGPISAHTPPPRLTEEGGGALGATRQTKRREGPTPRHPMPERDPGRALARAIDAAKLLRIEPIEARRGIPVLDRHDVRRILAYLIHVDVRAGAPSAEGDASQPSSTRTLEILAPTARQIYEDGALVEQTVNRLGVLPVVHIQNASQPLRYEGVSDVEPLIPIQDELNTRLSDRAHRVTMQSFNLYLAKGLEGFDQTRALRVGPGQIWHTDNVDASIDAFGADGHSPSEDAHIDQLRDAMDKISGVSPVAIGVIRARLGHLSSENALRIALMGVLSKTARKRQAYGRGIAQMSELILRALDVAGVYRTSPDERRVRLEWDDPLPIDELTRLRSAMLKRELGVPGERVLGELGYAPTEPGIT